MKTDLWKNVGQINKRKISKFLNVTEISKLIEFLLTQKTQ